MVPSGVHHFEFRNGLNSYGIDLAEGSCTCRLWEVSGIPCVHAQLAIMFTNQDPVKFISGWFSKGHYNSAYVDNILPVNGSNLWQETTHPKPLPPIERRMPGRPSVKKRMHVSKREDNYSQKGRIVTCTNCLENNITKLLARI